MLSRQAILKPALNFIKIDSVAKLHVCLHTLNSPVTRCLKRDRRNVFGTSVLVRHNSSNQPPPLSDNTPVLDPIPEPPLPIGEIAQSTAESVQNLSGVEPSFVSQGLGGWTPVGLIQQGLEYLHVDCGLPWWGAVMCGTLIIRILLFPVVIKSQRNIARLNNNLPQLQYIQMKITAARQRGDKIDAARYSNELMKFLQEKDVNPIKNLLPTLIQAPIFVSMFMGLRGLANVPVESLKTGGILWFVDLTVPDQFYVLPIITSATLFLTITIGGEGAHTSQNQILMRYFMYGLPVLLIPFTLNFQGLILMYWVSSNFISLLQVGILKVPGIREFFKIPKKIHYQQDNLPIQDKGFVTNVKESWANMKIQSELSNRERADKMAFMAAGREPIKKTYKYDPTSTYEPEPVKKQSPPVIQAAKKKTDTHRGPWL